MTVEMIERNKKTKPLTFALLIVAISMFLFITFFGKFMLYDFLYDIFLKNDDNLTTQSGVVDYVDHYYDSVRMGHEQRRIIDKVVLTDKTYFLILHTFDCGKDMYQSGETVEYVIDNKRQIAGSKAYIVLITGYEGYADLIAILIIAPLFIGVCIVEEKGHLKIKWKS